MSSWLSSGSTLGRHGVVVRSRVKRKVNQQTNEIKYYQLGGLGNETATGLVKSGNQVIIAGSFTDEITFAGTMAKNEEFGTDIFIAAFGEDCTPVSLVTFKGNQSEFPCAIISSGTGIYLAGGGSMLRGLDRRISMKTKLPVHIAEDPLRAVARGTSIALKNIGRFQFLMR